MDAGLDSIKSQIRSRSIWWLKQQGILASFARGAVIAFLIQTASTGVRYLSQLLIARWVGPKEYGAYIYSLTWAQLLAVLAGLGLTTVVLRYIPQYLATCDWGRLRGLIRRSSQLTLGVGVSLAFLGMLTLLFLHPQSINYAALTIGFGVIPLLALSNLQMEMIRGTQRMIWALAPPLLVQPLLFVGMTFLILMAANGLNSVSVMSTTALAILATILMQTLGMRKVLPQEAICAVPVYETREWLHIAFPLLIVAGFTMLLGQTDILLVGTLRGVKDAGIYAAAARTATLASFTLAAGNAIAAPMIASLYARGDRASLQRMVNVAIQCMFWPSLITTLILVFFGNFILRLFGPEFGAGHWALTLLAVGQLVNTGAGPVANLMNLTGHQNVSIQVFGLSALVNLVLNLILIPVWGLTGAAWATMISMILWNVWLSVLAKKHLNIYSFVFASAVIKICDLSPKKRTRR